MQPDDASANLAAAWTPLGPATVTTGLYGAVTGRVTSIALDPNDTSGNTVWLGTTGGGVWKSTNAAGTLSSVSFAPLTDTLPVFAQNAGSGQYPSLSIGAVAVQPTGNPVVLAGTGDPNDATDSYYGEGILRTADSGQTWTIANETHDGTNGNHSFTGLATAGLAWSTSTPNLVVAALSLSGEGNSVGANNQGATPGLYYSTDAGVTWQTALVMDGSHIIEEATAVNGSLASASATSVVWDAHRQLFFAALAAHGYFSSPDGHNWTRLSHQPGAGLTSTNCPTLANGQGSVNCPIARGTLALQPVTGDLYAITIDASDSDQGLWQDLCNAGSSGSCAAPLPAFANRLDAGAYEVGQGATGGSTAVPQGTYNLSLAALPASGGGTLLFAGLLDLYRCPLGAGSSACTLRNTTNAGNGCNATAGVAPAQHALAFAPVASGPMLLVGNDGGLWRSLDGVAETGTACSSGDAAHFQNLNAAIGAGGSLAEVVSFAQDPSATGTLIAGLGTLGSAASPAGGGTSAWTQLSGGEGGFPLIDQITPANWYVSIGAGVNLKGCAQGATCPAAAFSGSADIGAIQTGYDAALLDAPLLLDPQMQGSVLVGTCRLWRGPAQSGSSWNAANALSTAFDGGTTPCSAASAFVRSVAAGGPLATSGPVANQGSEVIYAGMAGLFDGGGSRPGHVFLNKLAGSASANSAWSDITSGPVSNNGQAFNASGFDVSSLVVDPHDATGATVYATIMGFGSGPHVYRSTDFGAHWASLSANLPSAPANAVVVDPNNANTVYVGTDTGVYATTGVSTCVTQNCWTLLGSGLPNAPVTALAAGVQLPTGDGRVGMLRVGTYGRGLWQTPLLTAHSTLQPQLSASPGSLSFLAQPMDTQSDALSITVLSFGNAPAAISSLAVTGDFAETDNCAGQTLAVGSNCTIAIRFAPTATGGRSGLLTLYANVPGGQITVSLSGTGTAPPSILLTPLQLSFAPTTVNQTAATQIVTISNTGGNPATLQSPTITGDFAITANTCGTTLPSQVGCSLVIAFTPTASGNRSGTLSLVDSAGTQTAQLGGVGQSPPTDTLSRTALSFSAQPVASTSPVQQITLSNAGDLPLTLVNAVIASGDFSVVNSCGASLAAHSSCALNVSFVPKSVGSGAGVLQISDEFRTQRVGLSGSGVAPAGVSLSPATIAFGAMGVGLSTASSTVTFTNNGGVPLLMDPATVTGDFEVMSTTCGAALQPSEACTFLMAFVPTTPGQRSGALTMQDNSAAGKHTVLLNGTGIDFSLTSNGPTALTVSSGAIATFPLQITSLSGLPGTVSFTCTGAPSNTACTVNPSPVQLGGTYAVSVTLQTGVATSSQSDGLPGKGPWQRVPPWTCLVPMPLLLGIRRRRSGKPHPFLIALLGLSASALLLGGCGTTRLIPDSGAGSGNSGTGSSIAPTQPGSYPITITGSSSGIAHSVTVTLTVSSS